MFHFHYISASIHPFSSQTLRDLALGSFPNLYKLRLAHYNKMDFLVTVACVARSLSHLWSPFRQFQMEAQVFLQTGFNAIWDDDLSVTRLLHQTLSNQCSVQTKSNKGKGKSSITILPDPFTLKLASCVDWITVSWWPTFIWNIAPYKLTHKDIKQSNTKALSLFHAQPHSLPASLCQKAICFHGDSRDVR